VRPDAVPGAIANDLSQRTWLIAVIVILAIATALRVYQLSLVPLHHDEGVNGNFLVHLVRDGYYHYDPANYHGPTLYYFAAIFPWLLRFIFGIPAQNTYGLTTVAIRLVPVVFGIATIGLIFLLRRNLGTVASLSAGFLLAVSPGAVYLSRYFIHETLFVFFTLGIVVAAVKFYEDPRPLYLILLAISAALLFATKETAIVSVVVLLLALICVRVFLWLIRGGESARATKRKTRPSSLQDFAERAGGSGALTMWLAIAVGVFVVVYVLFYSSFFTNYPKGVSDSLKTFQFWSKTGKEAHVHRFETYVWWLLLQESPLLFLGAAGAALALFRPARSFALFVGFWGFGLITAYSLIAYKTPWLALNFLVPLALCSGFAIQWLYERLADVAPQRRWLAAVAVILVAMGPLAGIVRAISEKAQGKTFIPGYQTIDLNFINYDNDNPYYVYVYAHTRRETHKLMEEINRIAERTHQGGQTGITIVSPDYWPLPWYLRDYSRVGYFGHMTTSNEPIVIASQGQAAEVQATFGDRYQQIQSGFNPSGSFPLRPGVDLLLFTRRELVR
jgi:uncharacterized protein (TIGR03663 family)